MVSKLLGFSVSVQPRCLATQPLLTKNLKRKTLDRPCLCSAMEEVVFSVLLPRSLNLLPPHFSVDHNNNKRVQNPYLEAIVPPQLLEAFSVPNLLKVVVSLVEQVLLLLQQEVICLEEILAAETLSSANLQAVKLVYSVTLAIYLAVINKKVRLRKMEITNQTEPNLKKMRRQFMQQMQLPLTPLERKKFRNLLIQRYSKRNVVCLNLLFLKMRPKKLTTEWYLCNTLKTMRINATI